jgi:tetratricopeptide (TPR) repeat protein
LEAVQWGAQNSFWTSILRLAEDRQESFNKQAQLKYFQAWAFERQGDAVQADLLARQALEMTPLADLSARTEVGPIDEATHQALDEHFRNGVFLHESGMLTWSEREFQRIIQRAPVWTIKGVEARSYYVMQLLKDQARYQDAADALLPLVERVEQDGAFRKSLIGTRGLTRPDDFRVELDYCRAMSLREKDMEQARKFFRDSLKADPFNPDTLIGMYELPGDASWKSEVETRIAAATEKLEATIRQEENARRASDPNFVTYYNNYAWLVSNTIGDQELALKRAKKAVELAPGSGGEMDTYARCLFRNGKLEEAIAMQTRAVERLPHSAQLKRQLEFFLGSRSPNP